jgi:hypothetical protein
MVSKSMVCPVCKGSLSAMFSRLPKQGDKQGDTIAVPNRKYCAKCDKIIKYSFTFE